MRKIIMWLMVVSVVVSLVMLVGIGCKQQATEEVAEEATEEATEEAAEEATEEAVEEAEVVAEEEEIYVQIVIVYGVPFWLPGKLGWFDAGDYYGVTAEYTGQDDNDPVIQSKILDEQIARGVDGIALSPADKVAMNPAIERVQAAGIPVVTFADDTTGSERVAYIGNDNYDWGRTAGEGLCEAVDYKGQVALSYGGANPSQEDILKGYTDVIAQYPDMEVVAVLVDAFDYTVGLREISNMLPSYPDLVGIGGCDATSGPVAAQAVQEFGYDPGDIKITAMATNNDTLQYILDGWISATYEYNTYLSGFLALQTLYQYNHIDEMMPQSMPSIDLWKDHSIPHVADHIDMGFYTVDKNNAEAHLRDIE